MKKNLGAAVLGLALLLALAACGSDDATDAGSSGSSSSSAPASAEEAALTVTDPWVKAADSGMTASFGTLVNKGSKDITVVSASTKVNKVTELHETVQNADGSMAMQPKKGGFVVPAGGSLTLEPGGNHIMLMELTTALKPGETVPVTLTLDDGSTMTIDAVVKPFEGADEKYQNDGDMGDMGDMGGADHDMSDMGGMG